MTLTGYVLTPALDGPDMVHLDPLSGPDGCGGRKWGTGDLEQDEIEAQQIDHLTAMALIDKGQAVACRRCGLKAMAKPIEVPATSYSSASSPEEARG